MLLLSSLEKSNDGRTEAADALLSLSYCGQEDHDVCKKSDGAAFLVIQKYKTLVVRNGYHQ